MKALWSSAAALAIMAAVTISPAIAQGSRPFGSSQTGIPNVSVDPSVDDTIPHYEWQYHYAGSHARWQGHWVLVKPPAASVGSGAGGNL